MSNLTAWQKKVTESKARFRVINAGRRTGKTFWTIELMVFTAVSNPDARILYISPTFQSSRDIAWSQLKQRVQDIKPVYNESRLEVVVPNEHGDTSQILLRSWDSVETIRGQYFDLIVLDEVAMFNKFYEGWQEVLLPTLTDKKGKAIFVSTPKGFNHFHDLFSQEHRDWESFHFTTYDNPHIDPEEIENLKESMSEDAFAQEYLADFTKSTGYVTESELVAMSEAEQASKEVFDWLILDGENYIDQCEIIKDHLLTLEKNYPRFNFYVGIDVAKSVDSTVVTVLRDKSQGMGKINCVAIDSTGAGDFMPDWFERNTRWFLQRVKFTIQSKDALYKNLKAVILKKKTKLPPIYEKNSMQFTNPEMKRFVQEMLQLQVEYKGNFMSVKHPDGNYHDDMPDSLALAEHAYTTIHGLPKDEIRKPVVTKLADRVQEMLQTRRNEQLAAKHRKPFTYE